MSVGNMNISNIKIDSLIPYKFNNKIHSEEQVDHIANSIKEFGFLQPIVIDKNNVIVAGHGRREASKKLGMEEVPVILADTLTDTQIKKYRILDNKLSDMAEWDMESIKLELEELDDEGLNDLFPDIELDIENKSDDFSLPDGDKGEIEIVTFTLHNEQNRQVQKALSLSKSMGEFRETGNENSNGNALARICEIFTTQNI